jgi:hypothetical protein
MKNIFIVGFLVLLTLMTCAQEDGKKDEDKGVSEFSFFLGAASNEDGNAFSMGVDYQYRLGRVVGIGALADYAGGHIQSTLIAPAVYLHAWKFEFTVAPAIEITEEEIAGVLRLGAAFAFELKGVSIIPAVFWDSERNHKSTLVYGVGFAFKM